MIDSTDPGIAETTGDVNSTTEGRTSDQDQGRLVFCLCVDMIGSTECTRGFSTALLDCFNRLLVDQIKPHLQKLQLHHALAKFTGDGWIVMTPDSRKISALCCLATIMANRFQYEMHDKIQKCANINVEHIPKLRLAVCSGRDINVELPDGRSDWVGDSARKATRASGWCYPNDIIIDDTIRTAVSRDFCIELDNVEECTDRKAEKWEEDFSLHLLGDLKPGVAAESSAPERFVYTLDVLEEKDKAEYLVDQVSQHMKVQASKPDADKEPLVRRWNRIIASRRDYSAALETLRRMQTIGLDPDVVSYNTLVSRAPEYAQAVEWVERMPQEGIVPNVVSYNTLVSRAPDYAQAVEWVERMPQEGILPNVVSYNTLVSRAPDYAQAVDWVETMRQEGIVADVVTYNTLVSRAPDYAQAVDWVERMRQEGIAADVVTYNTLVSLAPDYGQAIEWVERMRQKGIVPDVVTYNTLVSLAPDYGQAVEWVETMRQEGILPDLITYSTLFSKDLSAQSADSILEWYMAQEYRSEEPIQAAIATYRKSGRIGEALRLALDYPHTQAAGKLMRDRGREAVSYFKSVYDRDLDHPNASYALGVALMELGTEQEALPYLAKALSITGPEPRKTDIKQRLRQIHGQSSQEP